MSAIDPETGDRYLYHEETGESKWPSPSKSTSKSTSNKAISWIKYYDDEGTHSLTHLLTHSLTYSLSHLLTHSLTYSLMMKVMSIFTTM